MLNWSEILSGVNRNLRAKFIYLTLDLTNEGRESNQSKKNSDQIWNFPIKFDFGRKCFPDKFNFKIISVFYFRLFRRPSCLLAQGCLVQGFDQRESDDCIIHAINTG